MTTRKKTACAHCGAEHTCAIIKRTKANKKKTTGSYEICARCWNAAGEGLRQTDELPAWVYEL